MLHTEVQPTEKPPPITKVGSRVPLSLGVSVKGTLYQ